MPINIPGLLGFGHSMTLPAGHGLPATDSGLFMSMWFKIDSFGHWGDNGKRVFNDNANFTDVGLAGGGNSRLGQSLAHSSENRYNSAASSFRANQWNHMGILFNSLGFRGWFVNGNNITRSLTAASYTGGTMGTVRLFSKWGTGNCFPPGLVADISWFSGAVEGAAGTSHQFAQALSIGSSPETGPQYGHTLVRRNKFLDSQEDWSIGGGQITVQDNFDYPPVDDYAPHVFAGIGPEFDFSDPVTAGGRRSSRAGNAIHNLP